MVQVKYIVKASPAEDPTHITEEELSTRELMNKWIALLKQNGWKIIGHNTKGVS